MLRNLNENNINIDVAGVRASFWTEEKLLDKSKVLNFAIKGTYFKSRLVGSYKTTFTPRQHSEC
jgi:hypothetical protein